MPVNYLLLWFVMLLRLLKWFTFLLLAVFMFCIISLGIVRFFPEVLLSGVNKLTDYHIVTDGITVNLNPLKVTTKNLTASYQKQQFTQLEDASLSFDWLAGAKGIHSVWKGNFSNGVIDLRWLAERGDKKSEKKEIERVNIHALLTALGGRIDNVRFLIDEQAYFLIKQLKVELDPSFSSSLSENKNDIKQTLEMDLVLNNGGESLLVNGRLTSFYLGAKHHVRVTVEPVDFTKYLTDNKKITNEEQPSNVSEGVLDWTWLTYLDELTAHLQFDAIRFNDNEVLDLNAKFVFGQSVHIQSLNAFVDWALSDDIRFSDKVAIEGSLKPLAKQTKKQDIDVDVSVQSKTFKVSLNGELNLNGLAHNNLMIELQASELPIELAIKQKKQTDIYQQYFPLASKAHIIMTDKDVMVELEKSTFGISDIAGELSYDYVKDVPSIKLTVKSDKLSYLFGEKMPSSEDVNDNNHTLFFTQEPLNWGWLHDYQLQLDVDVKELNYGDLSVGNVSLPVRLQNNELQVVKMSAVLGGGELDASLLVKEQSINAQNSLADVSLSLTLNNSKLDSFGVFPKEQLDGGDFSIQSELELTGQSAKELASSANGFLFVKIKDAVIKNNSLGLVGSDLIVEMLNKLNPFRKSDPHTHLDCAIAYLPINNGNVNLTNGLAVKTSKMVIKGDGNIDLADEKINVKLSPSTRSGVGLNVGRLVKFVKLGGTLMNPKLAVDATGLLTTGIAVGAALSTGGVSLLADSLVSKISNENVCEKIQKKYKASK